jgi:hypothetical protein
MAGNNPTGKGLKPIKPGEVRNPTGRPKKSKAVLKIEKMSREMFAEKLYEFGTMTKEQLKEKLADKKTNMLEVIFGRLLVDAGRGKTDATKLLFDRLWGKVKEEVSFTAGLNSPQIVIQMPSNGFENKETIETVAVEKTE